MKPLKEHSVRQSQKQHVKRTDRQSVKEQHAPKSSGSSHIQSIEEGSFCNEDGAKQSELQDLATTSVSGPIKSFKAGSVQSEDESRPTSDQRDRPKESVPSLSRSFEEAFRAQRGRIEANVRTAVPSKSITF